MSINISHILKHLSKTNMIVKEENPDSPSPRTKKRRLDHLTWEEKLQRKKLKNREAAQTSRDRKKQKMEELEQAVRELFRSNETLMAECKELRQLNKTLAEENTLLYNVLQKQSCAIQNRSVECEVQQGSTESIPLPKGLNTYSAATLETQFLTILWKIVLACLLYRSCSMNSKEMWTSTPWRNLPKAYSKISPQTWRIILRKQIVKNQMLMNSSLINKWWGRHQKTWNPVDVKV